jgi:hypothetical protein
MPRKLAGAEQAPAAIDLDRLKIGVKTKSGRRIKPAREATLVEVRAARRQLAGRPTDRATPRSGGHSTGSPSRLASN